MASSLPPDVVVVDSEFLIHARFEGARKHPRLSHFRAEPLPGGVFSRAVVTPVLEDTTALTEAVRRLKAETPRLDRVSILLPDSWFRIHLSQLSELPAKEHEADEMVRWTLMRSLPMRREELRIAYQTLAKSNGGIKVLVLGAMEKTLTLLEDTFRQEQVEINLLEPIGLNIWNAVSVRERRSRRSWFGAMARRRGRSQRELPAGTGDRLFFYFRHGDFTAAVFRGQTPLFIRSRNLGAERSLLQEIRLSASYLRGNPWWDRLEGCFVAGKQIDQSLIDSIEQEFQAPVRKISLRDFAEFPPDLNVDDWEAELTACAGVFTA